MILETDNLIIIVLLRYLYHITIPRLLCSPQNRTIELVIPQYTQEMLKLTSDDLFAGKASLNHPAKPWMISRSHLESHLPQKVPQNWWR
jgi:hypothetical protein